MEANNRKREMSQNNRIKIWERDSWTCRYCGVPVFYAPSLKLLDRLNPNHGYFHPNGKEDKILKLFQWQWASVDHIIPFSDGGNDNEENLVTACWGCNNKYNDIRAGDGKPKPKSVEEINSNSIKVDWDGFYGLYNKLK